MFSIIFSTPKQPQAQRPFATFPPLWSVTGQKSVAHPSQPTFASPLSLTDSVYRPNNRKHSISYDIVVCLSSIDANSDTCCVVAGHHYTTKCTDTNFLMINVCVGL